MVSTDGLTARFSCSYTDAEPQQDIYAKGDEYHKFRESAKEHRDSMRSYFKKAATACSKGELEYAAYLSDQVTYLFDKKEEWLGIVLLEALQNGAAVLDLKKLENLFYYIFDT
uniref:DUF1771 domain-containing protein n=1 Tax=Gossypium raimondii TaxID=29730 RepID=A0A0D2Q5N9_GOSRA|nr:hypothetical protein B456_009G278500 [Gossypium raimondii]